MYYQVPDAAVVLVQIGKIECLPVAAPDHAVLGKAEERVIIFLYKPKTIGGVVEFFRHVSHDCLSCGEYIEILDLPKAIFRGIKTSIGASPLVTSKGSMGEKIRYEPVDEDLRRAYGPLLWPGQSYPVKDFGDDIPEVNYCQHFVPDTFICLMYVFTCTAIDKRVQASAAVQGKDMPVFSIIERQAVILPAAGMGFGKIELVGKAAEDLTNQTPGYYFSELSVYDHGSYFLALLS